MTNPQSNFLVKMFTFATILFVLIIAIWLAGSSYLLMQAPSLIYTKSRGKNQVYNFPSQTEYLQNQAQERLEMMWLQKENSPVAFLYLHGNGGRSVFIVQGLSEQATVLSPAYPGFHRSQGQPTTRNINESAEIALRFLLEKGYEENQIIVIGHSLGGSPAVYLAKNHPQLQKVILVNTFASIQSMCERQYGPLCALGGQIHNSLSYARQISDNLKIRQFHDLEDEVIPYDEGQKLFAAISSNDKKFTVLAGSHNSFKIEDVLQN